MNEIGKLESIDEEIEKDSELDCSENIFQVDIMQTNDNDQFDEHNHLVNRAQAHINNKPFNTKSSE